MSKSWGVSVCLGIALGVAHADEKIQRVVPPRYVIPGLSKALVLQHGGGLDLALQEATAQGIRTRLGWDDRLQAPEVGLKSQVVDFVLAPGPATMDFGQLVELASAHGVQLVVSASGAVEETEWTEWEERRTSVRIVDGQSITDEWQVRCARRSARIAYACTLYDAGTGEEHAQYADAFTDSHSDCDERGDDPLNVASAEALYRSNLPRMGAIIASGFVPRWTDARLQTQKDAATKDTLAYAADGHWERFLDATVELLRDDPYNPIAMLHVGVGLEALGALPQAELMYRYADRVKETPVTRTALKGAADRISERRVLREAYGIDGTWSPPANVAAWVDIATKALATVVKGDPGTVKGEKNKRVPLLSAPDGDVVVQVPGGTDLRVLAVQGEMVHVQLPDGVEGWMSAKLVRT